jgi:CBS domain-containing protein
MKKIREILGPKGYDVWSVGPDDTVFDAVKLMAEKGVGAIVVLEGEKLVGIVSERDYARKIILEGKSSRTTPVRDVMTPRVLCTTLDRTVSECLALMTDINARHLPIVDDGKVVGMVNIVELVKAKISEQEFLIEQLQLYIAS